GERDAPRRRRHVQRLDPEAVAGEQQGPRLGVPNGERKHAAEACHARRALLLVQMQDRFRVALGRERVSPVDQAPAQLRVVVDLPVEDDHRRPILVEDRLVTAREVDDAEATHAHADGAVYVDALVVGAPMPDGVAHLPDHGRGGGRVRVFVGGAERVVHALAIGRHRAGLGVRVVAVLASGADRHPFLAPLEQAGVETIPLRVHPRAYVRERTAIADLCRRLRPDVVHTHGYHVDVVDAGAARRAGVPTVTTVHGFTGGDWKSWIYERLARRAFRRFDAVVAVSRPLARDLERGGVPAARLHMVPNASPANDLPPLPRDQARAGLAVPNGRFHVGWVGRGAPAAPAPAVRREFGSGRPGALAGQRRGSGAAVRRVRRVRAQLTHGRHADRAVRGDGGPYADRGQCRRRGSGRGLAARSAADRSRRSRGSGAGYSGRAHRSGGGGGSGAPRERAAGERIRPRALARAVRAHLSERGMISICLWLLAIA